MASGINWYYRFEGTVRTPPSTVPLGSVVRVDSRPSEKRLEEWRQWGKWWDPPRFYQGMGVITYMDMDCYVDMDYLINPLYTSSEPIYYILLQGHEHPVPLGREDFVVLQEISRYELPCRHILL